MLAGVLPFSEIFVVGFILEHLVRDMLALTTSYIEQISSRESYYPERGAKVGT